MVIQFHTDNNLEGTETLTGQYQPIIDNALKRFGDRVSRLIISLGDENGKKEGSFDKRCMIEARLDGLSPQAVTAHAGSIDQAIREALDKIKAALSSVVEKQRDARKASRGETEV
jgi:hypothetical protein